MKTSIVTGGSGLIGKGICEALKSAGWDVASFDLVENGNGNGSGIHAIHCDVSDEDSVVRAFDELDWENLDLLVNNAGISRPVTGPITNLSLTEWRRVTDSSLTGAFLMTRAAVPLMSEGASIINMASTRAYMSEPDTEAYAAAKGGLVALTHSLAVSLGPHIRVNAIAPGWVSGECNLRPKDHAQHPVGRTGRASDIADAVIYLAGAEFITGQVLILDGGMTRKMIYAE